MKKRWLTLCIALCGCLMLNGQSYTAMPWCTLSHDAHSMAMGGISSLFTPFGMAASNNPAKLLFSEDKKMGFHAAWQQYKPTDNHYLQASGSFTHGIMGYGLSYIGGFGPELTLTDNGGNIINTLRNNNHIINASVGVRLLPIFSVGVNGKYLFETGPEGKRQLFAGDFFGMLDIQGFRASVGLRNLSSSWTYGDIEYKLPLSIVGGLGYKKDWEKVGMEIGAEYESILVNKENKLWNPRIGGGIAVNFYKVLSLRAGYNWGGNTPIPSYTSLGVGINIKFLRIDASYRLNTDRLAGDMLNIQLGIMF